MQHPAFLRCHDTHLLSHYGWGWGHHLPGFNWEKVSLGSTPRPQPSVDLYTPSFSDWIPTGFPCSPLGGAGDDEVGQVVFAGEPQPAITHCIVLP